MTLVDDTSGNEEMCDDQCDLAKNNYSRQNSYKRTKSETNEDIDIQENPYKRGPCTPKSMIPCPVADFGCLHEVPREHLTEHYLSQIHQTALMKAIMLYVKNLHRDFEQDSTVTNNKNDYSEIAQAIETLSGGISCINDDNIQLHTNVSQLYSNILELQKQTEQLKISIDETAQISQSGQISNQILQTDIENVKQMITDLKSQSSNDGTYIWKITDVSKKISEALSENQTSIYSPPFYSSPTGYKMCLRLYMNGDGNGRGTHLSLFIVLMRGEYDAVLQWPFPYKIIFCLMDQTGAQNHLIDSFRPAAKSNSFERPRSNMNIASGIPRFCPLPLIRQDNNSYVRDDCMFIQCIVDMATTQKSIIPFVCSLNPGLPTLLRQKAIQNEIERQNALKSTSSDSTNSSTTTNILEQT